jgi:RNA:NAD 2'-phosphotransferase (TPT1/KptA family)
MFSSSNSWQIIRHLSMVIHHDPVASGIWLDHIGSLSVRLTEHG